MADFGEIIETRYLLSEEQLNASKFGFSEVFYSGSPTVYSPGDVVNLPYASGETATMNALGAAIISMTKTKPTTHRNTTDTFATGAIYFIII
jgi:hypothetical protein